MRYIPIKIYKKNPDSEAIPFWELNCHKYGDEIRIDNEYTKLNTATLMDALWDVVEKKIIFGDIIEVKNNKELKYKEGSSILIEEKNHILIEDIIEKIEFNEYDSYINKTSQMSEDEIKRYFGNRKPELPLVELRLYKPTYYMKSGKIIKYDYMLYKMRESC